MRVVLLRITDYRPRIYDFTDHGSPITGHDPMILQITVNRSRFTNP